MTRSGDDIDEIERAVARYMRLHYGLITLAEALLMGFTPGMVQRRLEAGEWVLVVPGVYRAACVPHGGHQSLLAAVWAPSVDALGSHRSASWVWDLPSRAPDLRRACWKARWPQPPDCEL